LAALVSGLGVAAAGSSVLSNLRFMVLLWRAKEVC
jgi:hypothetical protein